MRAGGTSADNFADESVFLTAFGDNNSLFLLFIGEIADAGESESGGEGRWG